MPGSWEEMEKVGSKVLAKGQNNHRACAQVNHFVMRKLRVRGCLGRHLTWNWDLERIVLILENGNLA